MHSQSDCQNIRGTISFQVGAISETSSWCANQVNGGAISLDLRGLKEFEGYQDDTVVGGAFL